MERLLLKTQINCLKMTSQFVFNQPNWNMYLHLIIIFFNFFGSRYFLFFLIRELILTIQFLYKPIIPSVYYLALYTHKRALVIYEMSIQNSFLLLYLWEVFRDFIPSLTNCFDFFKIFAALATVIFSISSPFSSTSGSSLVKK